MPSCYDVMTKDPVCCLPVDMVVQLAQLMEGEDIGSMPVVVSHETNLLLGIVTDRDLALRVIAQGRDIRTTRVESIMTPNPWTRDADDPLEDAVDLMVQQRIRRIPVVADGGRIIGIISQADIAIRTDDPHRTARIVRHISQPSGDTRIP